jgi:ribonuclease HI
MLASATAGARMVFGYASSTAVGVREEAHDISNNNEAEMYAAVLGLQPGLEFWSELYPDPPKAITIASDSQHTRSRLASSVLPHFTARSQPGTPA